MTPPPKRDARERLRRAAFDLLAYGRHSELCTKGRVVVPGKGWRAPMLEKACSCGLDAALDLALTEEP